MNRRAILLGAALAMSAERRGRAGQGRSTAPVALGAAVASVAQGAGGLGRVDREGLERHHQVKVFPSQQLGKAFDHYDMARDGIADLAYVSPGYQPGRFPIIDAGNLPFMVANAKEGTGAIDEWYRKYAAQGDERREILLGLRARSGHVPLRTKKIVMPGDVKGMKMRPAHATMATWVTRSAVPTCRPPRRGCAT